MSKSKFYQKDYISIDQLASSDQIKALFKRADHMKMVVENNEVYEPLKGQMIAILFYQPSTRTFSSFSAAARRLGAYVVAIQGMTAYSSVVKGESLEDTIRSIYQTTGANAIVIRHPDNNSADVASNIVDIPIISGGSGKKEHPTQGLLDLYTIYSYKEKMDNLTITLVGDLLYGRTTKSLAKLLALVGKNNTINLVSPSELKAPRELVEELSKKVKVNESENLSEFLKDTDVLYMTRVQKEWFEAAGKLDEYQRLKLKYILTRHMASTMKEDSIIMHPLPRVGEIMYEVDDDPRAKYFEQMRSGLYTRMALLEMTLIDTES